MNPLGKAALSRRDFLRTSATATAAAAAGAYGLLDGLAPRIQRFDPILTAGSLPLEQYLFVGSKIVTDNGVPVDVPPLHHLVVTATLNVGTSAAALKAAQRELEALLA